MSTRVAVIDDQELFREGIGALLAEQEEIDMVGGAGAGVNLYSYIQKYNPDVVLVNVDMAGFKGADAIRQVKREFTEVKFIALTMYQTQHVVREMFKAGVAGLLPRQCSPAELVKAIGIVRQEQVYLSPRPASVMVDREEDKSSEAYPEEASALTEREYEVVRLLSEGKSSKEIAQHIHMSVQTVDACRRQIMKKLHLDSLAQLVKYAIREGLTGVGC